MGKTEQEAGKQPGKQPLYKKLFGVGIMAAAALYCVPELRETLRSCIERIIGKWRDQ